MDEGRKFTSLSSLGEFGLLQSLEKYWTSASPAIKKGVGDDCAVIALAAFTGTPSSGAAISRETDSPSPESVAENYLLLTTDSMVEGRHFLRSYSLPFQLGQKLCAVNLSDIAAMGGSPTGVLVTLQLPKDIPVEWIAEVYRGLEAVASRFSVSIVGGDTVESSVLALGITAFGFSQGLPLYRSGAVIADDIWVSGDIGGAGAGLAVLRQELEANQLYLSRYQTPEPRIALGKILQSEKLAHSLLDISDGLLQDAGHIAKQSGLDLQIDLDTIPFAAGLPCSRFSCLRAASSGDDYELLFSAPTSVRSRLEQLSALGGLPRLTRIGTTRAPVSDPTVYLSGRELPTEKKEYAVSEILSSPGFQHFQSTT